jgi:hypothetical protein
MVWLKASWPRAGLVTGCVSDGQGWLWAGLVMCTVYCAQGLVWRGSGLVMGWSELDMGSLHMH